MLHTRVFFLSCRIKSPDYALQIYDYKSHVEESSRVPDHCIQYSLSHVDSPSLSQECHQHEHDESCKFCLDLYAVIDDLEQIIMDGLYPTEEIRAEFIHDFQNARKRFFNGSSTFLGR